jgi:hypothetical protein
MRSAVEDVPCLPCQQGYTWPHWCDIPDYCPCDRAGLHLTAAITNWQADYIKRVVEPKILNR